MNLEVKLVSPREESTEFKLFEFMITIDSLILLRKIITLEL